MSVIHAHGMTTSLSCTACQLSATCRLGKSSTRLGKYLQLSNHTHVYNMLASLTSSTTLHILTDLISFYLKGAMARTDGGRPNSLSPLASYHQPYFGLVQDSDVVKQMAHFVWEYSAL